MISPVTGEVMFSSGLCFAGQREFDFAVKDSRAQEIIPGLGWFQRYLGKHHSEHGEFEVQVVLDSAQRVQLVLFSHAHGFYDPANPEDAERRVFHESILNKDLHGQQEFAWGRAYCRLDPDRRACWRRCRRGGWRN
jgi:hypothetical protein